VAKLSSAKTMSEANLATSVPVIPIATPMCAYFRAGASLTPSPVIATTWPISYRDLTSSLLCLGSTLENTLPPSFPRICFLFYSLSAANSTPVKQHSFSFWCSSRIFNSLATAMAVLWASPVIMITRIPAV